MDEEGLDEGLDSLSMILDGGRVEDSSGTGFP